MNNTARIVVQTDVTDWSRAQRERLLATIADIDGGRVPTGEPAPVLSDTDSGWTLEAFTEALGTLLGRHGVQATAITEAIKNGTGYIDRKAVYEIAGYDDSRTLKGFTRPVNRIVQQMIDKGALPAEADDLLAPVYDEDVKGYQRARGFQVPAEVVKMMHDYNRGKQDWAM